MNADTTPIPLCIERQDGVMIPVFPEGTVIPCEMTLAVSPHRGSSGDFDLNLYQGFNARVTENVLLAKLCIQNDSISADQWLVPITLAIDVNGILRVTAVDPDNQQSYGVRVEHLPRGLSDNDIADLRKKAVEGTTSENGVRRDDNPQNFCK